MKRIIVILFKNLFFLPYFAYLIRSHAKKVDSISMIDHMVMLKYIILKVNKAGKVHLGVHGVENLPTQQGYIMFPNHQGLYDVLAIIASCPHPCSMIAKKEADRIPLIRHVITLLGGYLLDRKDARQGMKVIQSVSKDVVNGRNFIIFPEGTRSKEPNKMRQFKGGSFKAATMARCPIIPVALIDANKPFDSGSLTPVTVQVHFLAPILYDEYKDMKTTEIAELVQGRIQEVLATAL